MHRLLRVSIFVLLLVLTQIGFSQPSRNKALDLTNGEGDHISIQSNSKNLIGGSAFTFETWIKAVDNPGDDFTFFDFTSGDSRLSFVLKDNNHFKIEADGGALEETDWVIDNLTESNTFQNKWMHVVFAYNGGSNVAIYVNGKKVFQQNLQKNGSNIQSLFPDDGGSYSGQFGGTSENGEKGLAYLADARIWKVRIPHSTIENYWDESVNKSHPYFQDLERYYPLNSDYLQNGVSIPKFADHVGNYDAVASESSASRIRVVDQYPPVKPPRFNSGFALSFGAQACQTNTVNVGWYDLANDQTYEPKGTEVWYELVRDDNTSNVIHLGSNSAFADNSLTPGEIHRYRLRTVWKVNGVNYYSDYSPWSNYGSLRDQFDAPSTASATTDRCDETVRLSWALSNTPPTWTVQRSTSPAFDLNVVELTASLDGEVSNYIASNQPIETDLYYRIKASGTDQNGCSVLGDWSLVVNGFTSNPPKTPVNGTITQDFDNNQLLLSWDDAVNNNADGWVIKRKKFDGSDEVEFTSPLPTTSYNDGSLALCQTYSYTLGAVNECATEGVFSPTDLTGNISADLSRAISNVQASKGYLPNAVQIEWELDGNLSTFDRFRLYRSKADQNNFSLIKILNNDLIYSDETALGSVFYNYKVVGEASCEDEIIYTNEGIDMGFVLPFGVANGHIEYDGGNPVQDVTVHFEKNAGLSGNSIHFDKAANSYLAIKKLTYENTGLTEMTVEAWVKTGDPGDQIIASFDRTEYWRLEINGESAGPGQVGLGIMTDVGNMDLGGTIRIDDQEWHHVAASFDHGIVSIYVDGQLDTSTTFGATFGTGLKRYGFIGIGSEAGTFNGTTGPNTPFNGNMDEIRIWEVAKSADEILDDYNRIINGNQLGLLAYWRCDEGIGQYVYDASQFDNEFNKNDAQLFGNVSFSSEKPNGNQLGIRGITNEFGDYTVDYIPYKSGGEIFRVSPALGQHSFEPSSRTVFVGDGAQTQNGLDFTDISSFMVTGKVTYENTNVPVEGVSIMIDGTQAIGVNNQPVRSDINGDYAINVPIGFHYLSAHKDGHTFSEGYFPPLNQYQDIQYFEFIEDVIVNFTDDTKITVAGRVVGGSVQAKKPIGFHKSLNNIGQAELSFSLQNDAYNLPIQTVLTDAKSGEYVLSLIPEPFLVGDITTSAGFSMSSEDIPVLDLRNDLAPIEVLDTLFNYEISQSGDTIYTLVDEIQQFTYHRLSNYVFFVDPAIHVREQQAESLVGDTIITFTNQSTGDLDTLFLGKNSPFDFPVFQMGSSHQALIDVQEIYSNPQHPDGAVVDYVPVPNAQVVVNNQLKANPNAESGNTNNDGVYVHSFIVGQPDLSEDGTNSYTKTFEVDVQTARGNYSWTTGSGQVYRGYVLGAKPLSGTDFISYGPEIPEIILRDPPGTNSYAFIEKGASYSTRQSWDFDLKLENGLDVQLMEGTSLTAGSGILITTETTLDNTFSMTLEKEFNVDGGFMRTVTFNERIETSRDPEDVGSDADVYIGRAYNAFMSKSKNFKPMPKGYADQLGLDYIQGSAVEDSAIVLGIIDGFIVDDTKEETYFLYSQKHIVHELVPSIMELRDNLFTKPEYTSNLSLNHRYYGFSNDHSGLSQFKLDSIALNSGADTANISYLFSPSVEGQIDSVALLNQQIEIWINTIAINELEKTTAETVRNISIDGSVGAFAGTIKEEFSSEYNYERVSNMKVFMNAKAGISSGGKGFKLSTRFGLVPSFASKDGQTRNNSIEFGYVIDERDEGDYYSIDLRYDRGSKLTTLDNFTANTPSKEQFWEFILTAAGVGAGNGAGKVVAETAIKKMVTAYTQKAKFRRNAYITAGLFTSDVGFAMYDMATLLTFRENAHKDMDNNGRYDVSDFAISSPIFAIRGGQSRCPYEGEEYTSFIVDNNNDLVKLHTATLQREVPVLDVEPSIRSNVPESEHANFTLKLQNLSESSTGMWYEIMVLEETNPNGLELKIDGLEPDRSFYVPAFTTVNKILNVRKTVNEIMNYDSIGVVLRSTCQFDPLTVQADISDTIYFTVNFLPECSPIKIQSLQDNWVVNYANQDQLGVTLGGYDINRANMDQINFQYKTLTGTPVTAMTFFKDSTSVAYQNFSGEKGVIQGGESSFIWNLDNLNDREYLLRATSVCSDGSTYESDYLLGKVDRVTPRVFGKPEPADGILDPSDNILIRFNEEIQAGLVKDFNINLKSVLNGADVSHGSSVIFNGSNEFGRIPAVSLNNKSFTVEFWLKRNAGSAGVVFSKGIDGENISMLMGNDELVTLAMGATQIQVDPTSYYSSVYPLDAWHHWTVSYNKQKLEVSVFMDDQLLSNVSNVIFNPREVESLYVANDFSNSNGLACEIHEFRIWEKSLTLAESITYMNVKLTGDELGLYGYWPMDEGDGGIALDQSSGRNMVLDANWQNFPGSEGYAFNGSNQFLTLDGSNVVISEETDMTIEFWFQTGTPAINQTVFSSGRGDLSDSLAANVLHALAIEFTPAGQILVKSNGNTFDASTVNYFDNQWHHFALVIDRKSNTKSYIDGALEKSKPNAGINGLAGSELWLGARGFKLTPIDVTIDQFYAGNVDEFRIWNSAKNLQLIQLYKNVKLEGTERGLLCYLPFEIYENVQGTIIRASSLSDEAQPPFLIQADEAVSAQPESFVEGAPIRDRRPVQDIPFEYVVNNDEIIITPLIDADRIEGQILEISVSYINDLFGNQQLSTASWTAYVQQNQLRWQESVVELERVVGEEITFQVNVANVGGLPQQYSLEGLPDWLTTVEEVGSISSNSTKAITFAIDQGLNIGRYERKIYLSSEFGLKIPLTVSVEIIKTAPDWVIKASQFQYSMSVFGRLIIEDVVSVDEKDMVAAFINDELRGVANVEFNQEAGEYLVFLNVYSNATVNDDIELRVWNASEGQIHEDVTPNLLFDVNGIVGTSDSPIDINANNTISHTFEFEPGWAWVSFNLDHPDLAEVDAVFGEVGTDDDLIKGQLAFDIYDPTTGWLGSLTLTEGGFVAEEMYKVYLRNGGTVKYQGSPVNTSTADLNIETGWNYIGFTPQVTLSVSEAMVGLSPVSGDFIKDQSSFAMFNENQGWVGSLKNMNPNEGYMLFSNNAASFTYPAFGALSLKTTSGNVADRLPENLLIKSHKYENTMSMVIEVYGVSDLENHVLIAFSGAEVRGYAEFEEFTGGAGLYFISVAGDYQEEIQFAVYNESTGELIKSTTTTSYKSNSLKGDLASPVLVEFENSLADFSVSPNPFENQLEVHSTCGLVHVQLFNAQSELIFEGDRTNGSEIRLPEHVSSGLFLLRMSSSCGDFVEQIIKQ